MGGSEAVRVSVSKDVFVCQECVLKAVWECVLLGDMHSGSVSEHFIPTNVVFQLPTCFQHTSCLCAYSIFYEQAPAREMETSVQRSSVQHMYGCETLVHGQ